MLVSAILFDMDGVLLDSRPVVERTWRRWAERHGLPVEPLLQIAHGRRTRDTLRAVVPHLATDDEVAWLDAAELGDLEIRPIPGAAALVEALPRGTWSVVTSAGRALARLRLQAVGLDLPDLAVTSEDIVQGKPAPDGYLLAARRLGVPPEACLVVEDAPPGVAAGRAAGAPVLAVTTTHTAEQLAGADYQVGDLRSVRVTPAGGHLLVQLDDEAGLPSPLSALTRALPGGQRPSRTSKCCLTHEQFVQPVAGSYGSVRGTLVHILSAEWGWLERCGGPPRGPALKANDYPTLSAVRDRWLQVESDVRGFLAGLKAQDLERPVEWGFGTGPKHTSRLGELLQHVFVHGVHHRGQVALLLRELGCTPGNFDILFCYDRGPSG